MPRPSTTLVGPPWRPRSTLSGSPLSHSRLLLLHPPHHDAPAVSPRLRASPHPPQLGHPRGHDRRQRRRRRRRCCCSPWCCPYPFGALPHTAHPTRCRTHARPALWLGRRAYLLQQRRRRRLGRAPATPQEAPGQPPVPRRVAHALAIGHVVAPFQLELRHHPRLERALCLAL